ncbi:MAG: hypothetical protein ACTS73_08425 [Arsenophonus sp. NEOnobi-MAG3]
MISFLPDYVSAKIQVNPDELISAELYHHDTLLLIPPFDTPLLARHLIEDTLALYQQENNNSYD